MSVIFKPETHQYFDESGREYPSVTKILKHFGMTPDYDKFGNDTSRDFGTVVHRVCELFDRGAIDQYQYDPVVEPWLNGYRKFISEFKPVWKIIEAPMASLVFGFAGTPDRVMSLKGRISILDLKTGMPDASHELQTAGYSQLFEESFKERVRQRWSLYLMPDDFRLVEHKNRSDRSVFIGLAQAFNWKKNHNLLGELK